MSRRRRGEGHIRHRKDGRWEGQYRLRGEGGRWQVRSVFGRTADEVGKKLRVALASRDAGTLPANIGKLTVGAYLSEWLRAAEPRVRGRTFDSYVGIVRVHLAPRIGGVPLAKLSALHVQRLHADMLAAGASAKTVRNAHALLNSALEQAVSYRLLAANPAAAVKPPRLVRREMTALTLDEARAVLAVAATDPLHALWRLAIAAGLRQGELCGLRWPDVDLDAGAVTVAAALEQRTGRKPVRAETKTARSRRTVPLDAATVEALRDHRTQAIEAALHAGRSYDREGWVFRRTRGEGPLTMSIVWKAWRQLATRAGARPVRFHDLRHTTATLMLSRGVDVRTVADVLGHADVATTLRTYVHTTEGSARRAAQLIGEALG